MRAKTRGSWLKTTVALMWPKGSLYCQKYYYVGMVTSMLSGEN